MMLRQAAKALRLPATVPRRSSSSLLATSSSIGGIDNFVLTPVNVQSKRGKWVWGSPPSSSSSSNCRGFADAVVNSESHWTNFPMAPPDPIIGLTEVRVQCFLVG